MLDIQMAVDADLPALAAVYVEAYNPLEIEEEWSNASALRLLRHLYNAQPDLFFAAKNSGRSVGAITAAIKPWWDGNHLVQGEFFIHPDFQHVGLGKRLLKKLFTEAKEKYQAISWDTDTHTFHENPLAWYKRLGFEEIPHWTMITGNLDRVLEHLEEKH